MRIRINFESFFYNSIKKSIVDSYLADPAKMSYSPTMVKIEKFADKVIEDIREILINKWSGGNQLLLKKYYFTWSINIFVVKQIKRVVGILLIPIFLNIFINKFLNLNLLTRIILFFLVYIVYEFLTRRYIYYTSFKEVDGLDEIKYKKITKEKFVEMNIKKVYVGALNKSYLDQEINNRLESIIEKDIAYKLYNENYLGDIDNLIGISKKLSK